MLEPHTTTVSSVILYQCQQPGLVPSSNSSVCEEDGRWSPDPSRVVCVMIPGTLSEIIVLFLFSASQYFSLIH